MKVFRFVKSKTVLKARKILEVKEEKSFMRLLKFVFPDGSFRLYIPSRYNKAVVLWCGRKISLVEE